jgi:hypothetical protein
MVGRAPVRAKEPQSSSASRSDRPASSTESGLAGHQAAAMALQRTAGNRAVARLLQGGGRPLDRATRDEMEERFGEDLGEVRVHTDHASAESARGFEAKAYAVGNSVVFGEGRYAPGSVLGKRLLAHELTHVLQSRRHPSPSVAVGPRGGHAEAEAHRFAERPQGHPPIAAPGGIIQRDPLSDSDKALIDATLHPAVQAVVGFGKGFLDGAQEKIKPESWEALKKELSDPTNIAAFLGGTQAGVPEGVLRDVWSLLEGLYDLAGLSWSIAKRMSPAYQAYS